MGLPRWLFLGTLVLVALATPVSAQGQRGRLVVTVADTTGAVIPNAKVTVLGLEDATKLHATHDGIPVAEMIKTIIDPRLEKLDKAIAAKSGAQFAAAFDDLTDGCNACHAAANKPFIRIQRPTAPPFSNQDFTPPK